MISFVWTVSLSILSVTASPEEDGKWQPEKHGHAGKYSRPPNEGKYIHIPNPYVHVNNPYDGGFGPYYHGNVDYEPYVEAASNKQEVYKYTLAPPQDVQHNKPGNYSNNGINIIEQNHNYGQDKYDSNFGNENKIRDAEKAVLRNPKSNNKDNQTEEFHEYIGTDGFLYRVECTAGVEGFHPSVKRIDTPHSGKWVSEKGK